MVCTELTLLYIFPRAGNEHDNTMLITQKCYCVANTVEPHLMDTPQRRTLAL